MTNEEMKELYESGDYLVVFKQKKHKKWDKCYRPHDLTWRNDFDYKLIHKKHEDILNAYLEDNSVEIEWNFGDSKVWQNSNFIESYNEDCKYRLKPKQIDLNLHCPSNFGFEPKEGVSIIEVPLYNADIYMFCDKDEFLNHHKEHIGDVEFLGNGIVNHYYNKDGYLIIMLGVFIDDLGHLVHELTHVCSRIFDTHGIIYDTRNDEPYAYLMQDLFYLTNSKLYEHFKNKDK